MDEETKECKFCKHLNYIDNNKCIHCGRYFPSDGPLKINTPREKKGAGISFGNAILIPPVALLISLFLPWISIFIMKLTAFDIAKFFDMTTKIAGRTNLTMLLINIMIYMIPIGCILFVILIITQRSIRMVGIITGLLPILILLLLISQSFETVKMLGIGFDIAIVSGIALTIISVKN